MAVTYDDELFIEEEKRRIENELLTVRGSYNIALNRLKELELNKELLRKFQNDFNNQFEQCNNNFNNIKNSFSNMSYSDDTALSELNNINQDIMSNVSSTLSEMQNIKAEVEVKIVKKEIVLNTEISNLRPRVEELRQQISELEWQLSGL